MKRDFMDESVYYFSILWDFVSHVDVWLGYPSECFDRGCGFRVTILLPALGVRDGMAFYG